MAESRYNRFDNQSPAQTQLKADSVSVGRSANDFSQTHCGNAIIGALTPVVTFDVVPNEDIDISLAALLEFRNPTTRQLFNGCRVYFHAYYNRLTDLWEGAKNWLDNGRSGRIQLTRPNLTYRTDNVSACTPLSLLNYFGLPAERLPLLYPTGANNQTLPVPPLRMFQAAMIGESVSDGPYSAALSKPVDFFPADCAMAYQRNWRDYYANKNLLQNNKYWFPDNEDHFILSYSCEKACAVKYEDENFSDDINILTQNIGFDFIDISAGPDKPVFVTPEANNPETVVTELEDFRAPNLSGLKFRQFRGDRFTTSLPFPDLIRGDIPSLPLNVENLSATFIGETETYRPSVGEFQDTDGEWYSSNMRFGNGFYDTSNEPHPNVIFFGDDESVSSNMYGNVRIPIIITPKGTVEINGTSSSLITMSDIYTMETLTAFRRRMGMTNGDYNEMIKAQYGVSPKVHDRKGTYIGGFYQDFAFSSVTQTSQSTSGADGSPLGQRAGQGVSSGSGRIGHFHTPDFGWIQIYMSVVPDVYYTQGKPRMFSKKSNLEMYFPLFNNLPAQAILNKELYISGNESTDNDVFAYEDRYAEYKSAPNRVSGFMGLSPSVATFDAARIIARRFSSTPALNSKFVTMVPENIDMSVFTVDDEPPFDFSIGASIRRVFPGPYTAIEGSLSSPALVRG